MADEQRDGEALSRSALTHEMAQAREHLAHHAEQLRAAMSLELSPRVQLARHPKVVLGVAAATGLFFAWLMSGVRRRARERRVLDAMMRDHQRRDAGWWRRLQRL
ncbi:MAG: hypothetical protein ABW321_29605 [Polyangiales bacterium]